MNAQVTSLRYVVSMESVFGPLHGTPTNAEMQYAGCVVQRLHDKLIEEFPDAAILLVLDAMRRAVGTDAVEFSGQPCAMDFSDVLNDVQFLQDEAMDELAA